MSPSAIRRFFRQGLIGLCDPYQRFVIRRCRAVGNPIEKMIKRLIEPRNLGLVALAIQLVKLLLQIRSDPISNCVNFASAAGSAP